MHIKNYFHKGIIGRNELVDFPKYELVHVPAKVDTGAYRSAIHATNIVEKDGVLSYTILDGHVQSPDLRQTISTKEYRKVRVTNSFGEREERFEVNLRTKLGHRIFNASFSLADRSRNVFPVLIGREMLNGRFMVDTSVVRIKRKQLALPKNSIGIIDEEEKE